ncbi:unnamed protein product [Prorocentrum cordatum]|uniref:Uncharacterized protein n=1 Tax=Prorocentrum cordatum TaxID=2364126 RepID=A0ABN9S8Y8_9DINO|nr:unnamed protein product [Polarella glacialis]
MAAVSLVDDPTAKAAVDHPEQVTAKAQRLIEILHNRIGPTGLKVNFGKSVLLITFSGKGYKKRELLIRKADAPAITTEGGQYFRVVRVHKSLGTHLTDNGSWGPEFDIQHEFERAAESFPVSVWVISLDVAHDPIRGDVSRPETIRFWYRAMAGGKEVEPDFMAFWEPLDPYVTRVMGNVRVASAARAGPSQQRLERLCGGASCLRLAANDGPSVGAALEASSADLVVFDGFNAEERFGHYVRDLAPGAMRVLDMQDFHALRAGREELVERGATPAEVKAHRPGVGSPVLLRELASIHRCDATLAVSEEERAMLVDVYGVPAHKVHAATFGHEELSPLAELPGFAARRDVMFIGNWRHRPNRDCAKWLVREVWPHVHELLPELRLNVYGANHTAEDMALTDERIGAVVQGYCKDVGQAMRGHRLLAAPLRYGAGVKGKLVEAMRWGLVTATTPVGVEPSHGAAGGAPSGGRRGWVCLLRQALERWEAARSRERDDMEVAGAQQELASGGASVARASLVAWRACQFSRDV